MPIIIRCEGCDKPIGWAETPCIFSPMLIEMGGTIFVDGGMYEYNGWFFVCEECRWMYDQLFNKPTNTLSLKMVGLPGVH
ncbi:MAG: hypothetical protein WC455_29995 [Dehalococcoidia bacterium]|jgi:hypothetical protein